MMRNLLFSLCLLVFASACNLYGGLSKPSGDQQTLEAARACFDQGDYSCALNYYNSLSSAYNDIRLSEVSLVQLAQANIFSMKDLVASLGDTTGSGSSFSFMANNLASRGITGASYRTTIQQIYLADNEISDVKLKAFTQFIVSVAMFNEVLANAIQNGSLTGSDIAQSPNSCKGVGQGGCGTSTFCNAPARTQMTFQSSDSSDMTSNTPVSGTATTQKLINAAAAATANLAALTGQNSNYTGLISSLQQFSNLASLFPGGTTVADRCTREAMLEYLGL